MLNVLYIYIYIYCVCVHVYDRKIYISNSMLFRIDDKLEKSLVKKYCFFLFFFYRTCFAILDSIFNGKCEKRMFVFMLCCCW